MKLLEQILVALVISLVIPGIVIALFLSMVKQMGDETRRQMSIGNETAEFFWWVGLGSLAFYGWLIWYLFL